MRPGRSAGDVDGRVGGLAEVSHHARSRTELFGTFVAEVAGRLLADLVQILEYVPREAAFVLRAGHGFSENLYGRARVPAGLLSQAGRALLDPAARPVSLCDFSAPHDWADDELVAGHGARSGLTVKVGNTAADFGVLGVFYRSPRGFTEEDLHFLAYAATMLGAGLERLGQEQDAIAWRSRAELLRTGTGLLRVPAERDELLSAAVLAVVTGGAGGSRPIADWCVADVLEANGAMPKLRCVAVDHAEGAAELLKEAFSVPLAPTAAHGAPRAYATRQAELVERIGPSFISGVARDPEHRRAVEEARPYSYVCAPVMGRDRFHGALGFLRVEAGTAVPYDDGDLAACAEFAALVGTAIDAGLPRPDIEEARNAVRTHATPLEHVPTDPTHREREVLELIAAGSRLTDIEASLHIDYQTVRTHKRHLCQKLGISTKSPNVRLIDEARRRGWLAA